MSKRRGFATIWDGLEYRQVSHELAEKLVKEDKAQDLSKRIHSATELKFRRDFTGYKTREIRAEQPTAAPVRVVETVTTEVTDKLEKADVPDPAPTPAAVDSSDWMKHKMAAAASLNKPFINTTKAETIAYMEKHLGLET